ncbi:Mediator-associated protein 1 [Forsythia ovata]|uniref:Mediator-associated protein 1 n=1 Tax=Forsythia ovata TaxID=205694 RepID=A0ABD1S1B7_9LAMI
MKKIEEHNEGPNSHSKNEEGALMEEKTQTTQESASKQEEASASDSESLQQNDYIVMPVQSNELTEKKSGQIFTKEDVITLLEGFINFKSEYGDKNMTEFHLFVKDKLHTEFTKIQITEKLRRLKEKYFGSFKKAKKKHTPLDFSNAHESTVFELSEKLWGNDFGDKKTVEKSNERLGKRARVQSESIEEDKKQNVEEDEVMKSKYPLLCQSFDVNIGGFNTSDMLKKNWTLMGNAKARNLEAEWRKLKIQELELLHKQFGLILKHLKD